MTEMTFQWAFLFEFSTFQYEERKNLIVLPLLLSMSIYLVKNSDPKVLLLLGLSYLNPKNTTYYSWNYLIIADLLLNLLSQYGKDFFVHICCRVAAMHEQ